MRRLDPKERAGVHDFMAVLDALPQLREVYIHNIAYGDDLVAGIPRTALASHVEVLDLSGAHISKRGMRALRDAEKSLRQLRALTLDAGSVGPDASTELGSLSAKLVVPTPNAERVARHALVLASAFAAARLTTEASQESHRAATRIRAWANRWVFDELLGLGEHTRAEALAILAWALGAAGGESLGDYDPGLFAQLPLEADLGSLVRAARLRERGAIHHELRRAEDQLWTLWRAFQDVTAIRAQIRALRWLLGFAPKWTDVPDHVARHDLPRPEPASADLLARLERVWNSIGERFGDPLPGPASEEEVDEAEREIGFRFPPDLRASYLRHGSESYPAIEVLSLESARRAWRESDRWTNWSAEPVDVGGTSNEELGDVKAGSWRRGWFPITTFESDCRCADLDPTPGGRVGQVFYWSHEGPGPSNMEQSSFVEWLEWAASEDGFEVFDE